MNFKEVVHQRKSRRWFTDQDIDTQQLEEILEEAARAPSFMNHQPWQVAIAGRDKMHEIAKMLDKKDREGSTVQPFPWPEKWPSYHAEIIKKRQKNSPKRILPEDAYGKYFYNASVTVYLHIHRELNEWSVLDAGAFAQTLMLAAADRGIGSVPQARVVNNPVELLRLLNLDHDRKPILGITMGHTDVNHQNNSIETDREPLEKWVTWAL